VDNSFQPVAAAALLIPGFLTQHGKKFFLSLNFGDPQRKKAEQIGGILLTLPAERRCTITLHGWHCGSAIFCD